MGKIKNFISGLLFSFVQVWHSSKLSLILLLLLKISLGLLPVLSIWLIENFFDSIPKAISDPQKRNYVYLFLVGIASVQFTTFILNSTNNIASKFLNYKFEAYMKQKLLNDSKRIPYIEYENSDFQNDYMRVLSSQSNILNFVESNLSLIQTSISMFSVVIYLIKIDIFFLSILVFMVFPLMWIELHYGKQRYNLAVDLSEPQRLNAYLESLLLKRETIKEIRINKLEDHFIKKWLYSFLENSLRSIKLDVKQTKWLIASNLILALSFIVSGGFVFQLIFQGALTIGVLAGVIQAIQSLQGTVPNFTANMSTLYESSLFVKDYRSFAPTYQAKEKRLNSIEQIRRIEANDLSFRYPKQENKILKNLSLAFSKGEKIAIMGKNGSGKTTLIKCLTGLYDTEGNIRINDEHFLENINLEDYWNNISILFQDFNKYDLTVKENIDNLYSGNDNMEDIIKATKSVGIHEYIEALPLKYNTTLGVLFQKGEELSGGQWQKIALARAFYKQANFLFLDEPTSALDPDSEYYIINNLLKRIEDSAVIFITHRINVAMLAEKIIMMDSGTIIEEGSHEELLSHRGIYFDLYQKQLNYLTKEEEGVLVDG